MSDFASAISAHPDLPEEEQVQAGKAIAGSMDPVYVDFLKGIHALIESKDIDVTDPQTFLKRDIYEALDQEWKDKTDLALVNIATLMQHIYEFWRSKTTPDESPQLQTMIMQLFEMKERIESEHDVFKF